ncbi:MAG: hypothetical protein R8J85_04170 [Mariprofundales bacterium]
MAYDPADLKLPAWLLQLLDNAVRWRLRWPLGDNSRWRLGMTRVGAVFIAAWSGVWAAALYSGNNLLYLCAAMVTVLAARALWVGAGLLQQLPPLCDWYPPQITVGEPHCWQHRFASATQHAAAVKLRLTVTGNHGEPTVLDGSTHLITPTATIRGRWLLAQRGRYQAITLHAETAAPLGLFTLERTLPCPKSTEIIALPRPVAWIASEVTSHAAHPSPIQGDEAWSGLRPYIAGDPLSRIHWRKASSGNWATKQFALPQPRIALPMLSLDLRLGSASTPQQFELLLAQAWFWLQSEPEAERLAVGSQLYLLGDAQRNHAAMRALAAAVPSHQPPLQMDGCYLLSLVAKQ